MIRTRLTLWNAIVMALVLGVLGAILYVTTRVQLYSDVDADLERGAKFFQVSWPKMQNRWGKFQPPPLNREQGSQAKASDTPTPTKDLAAASLVNPTKGNPAFGRDRGPMGPGGPGGPGSPEAFKEETAGMDPVLVKRIELDRKLGRPRILFLRNRDPYAPKDQPWDLDAFRTARLGERVFSTIKEDDQRVRVISQPLHEKGKVIAVVQFGASLAHADAAVGQLAKVLFALLPISLLVTTLAGIYLTGRAMAPVREVAKAAGAIEATNLSGRLAVKGNDEFASLAKTFNLMLERLESSFRSLAESNEAQKRFIADASHELKTPLTAIKTRVGIAGRGQQTPERFAEHMSAIGRCVDTMSKLVQDLLVVARSDEAVLPTHRSSVLVSKLVHDASSVVTAATTRPILTEIPDDFEVDVDPALMGRALSNLLSNAVRSTPPPGNVRVRAERKGSATVFQVIDEGCGIPAEHLPYIFDRFHRVESARDRDSGGTGLGLSITKSIVEAHGGTICMESTVGVGTKVTIEIPHPEKQAVA